MHAVHMQFVSIFCIVLIIPYFIAIPLLTLPFIGFILSVLLIAVTTLLMITGYRMFQSELVWTFDGYKAAVRDNIELLKSKVQSDKSEKPQEDAADKE